MLIYTILYPKILIENFKNNNKMTIILKIKKYTFTFNNVNKVFSLFNFSTKFGIIMIIIRLIIFIY